MASHVAELAVKAKQALGGGGGGGSGSQQKQVEIAGHKVHGTGYGLMGLTWRATPAPREQALEAMKTALDLGANFWNGGEFYGTAERNSAHLIREYLEKYPKDASKIVLSVKGGLEAGGLRPDGSAANVRRSIEATLSVLQGTAAKIDIWEAARVDPNTPIEETLRTAHEYVQAGKVGAIALSECSAATIRRAAAVTRVAAVEVEFSLWETNILRNGVAAACAELNIPIVAYSPLGRGFLTGQVRRFEDLPEGDLRRRLPRFQPEKFETNLAIVHELEALAGRKGCTPAQIALAWVRAQSHKPGMPTFVPIPGATTAARVRENMTEIELSDADLKEIDAIMASVEIVGDRYPAQALTSGDSAPLQE